MSRYSERLREQTRQDQRYRWEANLCNFIEKHHPELFEHHLRELLDLADKRSERREPVAETVRIIVEQFHANQPETTP